MAKKIKQGFGKIVKTLLKVLGITSILAACGGGEKEEEERHMMMYGCPENDYTIEGTVTDSSGNPIEGIQIEVKKYSAEITDSTEENVDEEGVDIYSDTETVYDNIYGKPVLTETDADGNYKLEWRLSPEKNAKFVLSAEDIDGEINGSFQNKESEVQFTENDMTVDGTWTDYYEKKNINISLDSLK